MDLKLRDYLGQVVRAAWIAWAANQPDPKPTWLDPWNTLSESIREVDQFIGETIFNLAEGATAAGLNAEAIMAREVVKWVGPPYGQPIPAHPVEFNVQVERERLIHRLMIGPMKLNREQAESMVGDGPPMPPHPARDWSGVVIYGLCPACGLYTQRQPYHTHNQAVHDAQTGVTVVLLDHLVRCQACGHAWICHETVSGDQARQNGGAS